MLFQKCGYLVGPENRIFRKLIFVDPKKKALTTEMNFRSYFHFKWIPERERERERRTHSPSSSPLRSQAPAPSIVIWDRDLTLLSRSRLRAVDRDLIFAQIAIGASFCEIASSIMISPSRRSRSREAAQCFARSRSTTWSSNWNSQSTAPSNPVKRQASIWVLFVLFWICLFLLLFQTLENIFRKICENATKHMKIFSFPKNSISAIFQKMEYFPEMLLHEPNTA